MVPGSYWPFRGFPAVDDADDAAFDVLVDRLGQEVNGLRVGPSYDGDPATIALIAAAKRRGWAVLDRFVADSYALDMVAAQARRAAGRATRRSRRTASTKSISAEHGALEWTFLSGADLLAGGFDQLAAIEQKSWIADRTDGSDAKFTKRRPRRVLASGGGRSGDRGDVVGGTADGRRRARGLLVRPQPRRAQICDRQQLRPRLRQAFAGQVALLPQPRRARSTTA